MVLPDPQIRERVIKPEEIEDIADDTEAIHNISSTNEIELNNSCKELTKLHENKLKPKSDVKEPESPHRNGNSSAPEETPMIVPKLELIDTSSVFDETPAKRRRGRPRKSDGNSQPMTKSPVKPKREKRKRLSGIHSDVPTKDFLDDENESLIEDDIPTAREFSADDWASAELNDLPTRIIENGVLIVKGVRLMRMIGK